MVRKAGKRRKVTGPIMGGPKPINSLTNGNSAHTILANVPAAPRRHLRPRRVAELLFAWTRTY